MDSAESPLSVSRQKPAQQGCARAWLLAAAALIALCPTPLRAESWPVPTGQALLRANGTAGMPAGYEPSGVAWHSRLERFLVVSDGGVLSQVNFDGTGYAAIKSGLGNLEGIAIANPASDLIYLALEGGSSGDTIKEFNLVSKNFTRTFSLTGNFSPHTDNAGVEALEFVRDLTTTEGGWFLAGRQQDGQVFVYSLPIQSSNSSTAVTAVGSFASGISDIAGLHYDDTQGVLYALHDGGNRLRAFKRGDGPLAWVLVKDWSGVPGSHQEGVTLTGNRLVIAEDSNSGYIGGLVAYDAFPTVSVARTALEAWRFQHFGTQFSTGQAADLADPDWDGNTNLMEWAMGGNPLSPAPDHRLEAALSGAAVQLTYPRSESVPGTALTLQSSTDLSPASWATVPGIPTLIGTEPGRQLLQHTVPAGGGSRSFFRLRATPP
jgi:hypothetical protein